MKLTKDLFLSRYARTKLDIFSATLEFYLFIYSGEFRILTSVINCNSFMQKIWHSITKFLSHIESSIKANAVLTYWPYISPEDECNSGTD